MDIVKLRKIARSMMAVGSSTAILGVAIMVHGEVNFGDAVLVGGIMMFIVGAFLLARTPTGDHGD